MNHEKIIALKKEILSLEKKISEIEKMPKKRSLFNFRIASALHELTCNANHIDGCGWEYDDGSWTRYSRKKFLERADFIIENSVTSTSDILDLLDLIIEARHKI